MQFPLQRAGLLRVPLTLQPCGPGPAHPLRVWHYTFYLSSDWLFDVLNMRVHGTHTMRGFAVSSTALGVLSFTEKESTQRKSAAQTPQGLPDASCGGSPSFKRHILLLYRYLLCNIPAVVLLLHKLLQG